ncbi:MAG: hypothetical protein J7L55_02620 [Desulfurococcales archaeon]|nr:hypothetical protein [Desulfurococcales archaeon]
MSLLPKHLSESAAVMAFLRGLINNYSGVDKGFMDDASAFKVGNKYVFFKIDGTSFRSSMYPWMTPSDLIYRVASGSVTDIIAKGGEPYGIAVSVGIPRDDNVGDVVRELGDGIADFLGRYGFRYMGGDMNSCEGDGWIDVAAVGLGERFIGNSPLRPGDSIYLTGCLGYSSIPALIHYSGLSEEFLTRVVDKVRRPALPLHFLKVGYVKASTDISDGLESLRRVLRINGVGLRLHDELPFCSEVADIMEEAELSPEEILYFLGEEFIVAYTGPGGAVLLGEIIDTHPGQIIYKGKVLSGGWDNFIGYINRGSV